jgi:hypothetical protein
VYSKQEAAKLKQQFWTAFGLYLSPVLSAEGEHINWLNYKTGKKDIFFRMNAYNKAASISIDITPRDAELQALYFEQFEQLKMLLHEILQEEWTWCLHMHDDNGKTISRIYTGVQDVNVFNKEDWPKLISFFKPRIIALDKFWSRAKNVFEVRK